MPAQPMDGSEKLHSVDVLNSSSTEPRSRDGACDGQGAALPADVTAAFDIQRAGYDACTCLAQINGSASYLEMELAQHALRDRCYGLGQLPVAHVDVRFLVKP